MKKIFALVFLSSAVAFGTVTACSSSATGTVLTGYAGATNGCAVVDLSFENLAITGTPTGTNGFVAPSLANTAVYATSSAFSGNAITPISLTYNPTAPGNWDSPSGFNTGSMTATFIGSVITHSVGGNYSGGGGPYVQPTANNIWFLNVISLFASGTVANSGGNSISITQTICLVTATYSAGCANRMTLTANFGQGAIVPTLGCAVAAGTLATCVGNNVDIGAVHVTQLSYSTSVTANRGFLSGTVDLNSFGNTYTQFADTPEPSTFGLLGAALVGLGFLARRRRKE